ISRKMLNTSIEVVSLAAMKAGEEYTLHASKLVEEIEYFPLSTADSAIIGKIDKIIAYDSIIYIFDSSSKIIFVFNDKGMHLASVNQQGHGPGEYKKLDDFTIDRTQGNILVKSNYDQKIFVYNKYGDFIGERPAPFLSSSFYILNDSLLAIYYWKNFNVRIFKDTYPKQPRLFILDKNNDVKSSDLWYRYDDEYGNYIGDNSGFYTVGDSLSFMESIGSLIYRIDRVEGQAMPRYFIDFHK